MKVPERLIPLLVEMGFPPDTEIYWLGLPDLFPNQYLYKPGTEPKRMDADLLRLLDDDMPSG